MSLNQFLFVISFHAVELMRNGKTPAEAAGEAILRISRYYPTFSGAVIALNMTGHFGQFISSDTNTKLFAFILMFFQFVIIYT